MTLPGHTRHCETPLQAHGLLDGVDSRRPCRLDAIRVRGHNGQFPGCEVCLVQTVRSPAIMEPGQSRHMRRGPPTHCPPRPAAEGDRGHESCKRNSVTRSTISLDCERDSIRVLWRSASGKVNPIAGSRSVLGRTTRNCGCRSRPSSMQLSPAELRVEPRQYVSEPRASRAAGRCLLARYCWTRLTCIARLIGPW